jgi:putative membrane protein
MSPFAKKLPFPFTPLHGAYVLLLFHAVGIAGMVSPWKAFFVQLTPFNLLLSATVLLAFHRKYDLRFWSFLLVCFTTGFGAEWLGVHTALIFGHYSYGHVLGPMFDRVPLIIGLNWYLLAYITVDISSRLKAPLLLKVLLGAALMTAMDFLIEPVAIRLGYWNWHEGFIPWTNYLGWFLVALPLQWLGHKYPSGNNPESPWLMIAMLFFFLTLHFI